MGIFKKDKTDHLSVGRRGEDEAVKYFRRRFYRILERNYRTSHYEIDFIAQNRRDIVFVEVKARSYKDLDDMTYGRPSEAITESKKRFLLYAVDSYLREHPKNKRHPRIDVVEIYFDGEPIVKKKKILKIQHIPSAFGR